MSRRGGADAAELVFRTFRRQHLEKFLPGLAKLGLDRLPHAVACAQYHYLSNHLGGVRVEYMYESDRKAWVRYVPPRWIYEGTAICGVPSEVSRAMLRAWHAHNGVSLGNPRLGFVCTKQTTDGQPGLEGYYLRARPGPRARGAAPLRTRRRRPGLRPRRRAARCEGARLARGSSAADKIVRNYAMDYVRTILPVLAETFGPAEAHHLGGVTGRLIGMQYYADIAERLGVTGRSADELRRALAAAGRGPGRSRRVDARGRRGRGAPALVATHDGRPEPARGSVRRVECPLGRCGLRAQPAPRAGRDAASGLGRSVRRVAGPASRGPT